MHELFPYPGGPSFNLSEGGPASLESLSPEVKILERMAAKECFSCATAVYVMPWQGGPVRYPVEVIDVMLLFFNVTHCRRAGQWQESNYPGDASPRPGRRFSRRSLRHSQHSILLIW
jgi:hypothetical protein